MEEFFDFKKHNTSLKTEVIAGITTFMTMAYIIFVNPDLLGETGMDEGAVMTATIITAAVSCILMGILTNYPFALASGMGLNAFFAFTVAPEAGWQGALAAVLISGIVFIILAFLGLIEKIDSVVPTTLKKAVAAGIGLFIALIGFQNSGIVVPYPDTLVTLGDLTEPGPIVSILGLVATAALMALKVKGAILLGIIISTFISFFVGLQAFPTGISDFIGQPASLAPIAFQLDFGAILDLGIMTIFALVFVDLFDTMGTLLGAGARAGYLNEQGNLPKVKNAMIADAIGTIGGALVGTSTVTTYVESTSGISEGGRTGATAVVVGLLFLLALFLAPFASMVPSEATAPALIIVGVLMIGAVRDIDFEDFTEAFPAFITIALMPFTYSIAHGIAGGFIAYPLVKAFAGRTSEIHWFNYLLGIISIFHFVG
ncbi:NCS2 family permease [Natranaerobius thermophilus]|uniref:Xanthine/uracil/vitamin C permease n=1 Tax=Natranaerobius thermophilus (strain ATCC BAA-1301 / DSM 18059 / JW/NM-WN-LF) TaxID=457570 RepID=B2A7G9_NATTJ|nr:NCS2 family permease [Natranaerobius thermophilus]ACB85678.1 Xanthine/uracil/vitamin C permease [Natranaerobius thermophilus JW/NM-WN-LF]